MISAAPVISRAVEPTPKDDRVVVSPRLRVALADPAEQEDLVVHREPEQHREEEQRHPRLDDVDLLEAEQLGADALLEDEHEQAVGRADGRAGSWRSPSPARRSSGTRPSAGRSSGRARTRTRSAATLSIDVEVVDVLGRVAADEHLGVRAGERLAGSRRRAGRGRRRPPRPRRRRPPPGRVITTRSLPGLVSSSRLAEDRRARRARRSSRSTPRLHLGESASPSTTMRTGSVVCPGNSRLSSDEALLRLEAVGKRADAGRRRSRARGPGPRRRAGARRRRRG